MTLTTETATADVQAAPGAVAAPFRLVDQWQVGYLKFAGRLPRTLQELAIARADHEHRRRLAEIRAMTKKLQLLDEFLPALAELGLPFSYRNISTPDGGKTLRIETPVFTLRDDKLHQALLELGFREVERTSYSAGVSYETVTLKQGRSLLVRIDVTKRPAE